MKDSNNSINKYFEELRNLYSANEELFETSFNKKIIENNIKLIKEKRYAITDDIWDLQEEGNHEFLLSLLETINKYAPDFTYDYRLLKKYFKKDSKNSLEFILNVLTNKQKELTDFSRTINLSRDFLSFFSIFSAYKYRNSVSKFVNSKYDLNSHITGLCPVCGRWPGISYLLGEKGTRMMACICCGSVWRFRRLKCSFCLTSGKDKLGYLNVEGEEDISAYTCDNCRRYIKTYRLKSDTADFSNEKPLIDYMTTGFIDIAAMQNKYVQESVLGTKFTGPHDKNIEFYIKELISE